MLSDRQIKARSTRERSVLLERVREFGKWLAEPMPSKLEPEDWYAGLGVDPTSFSDQLCKLQNSLRAAGDPLQDARDSNAVPDVAVEEVVNVRRRANL